MKTIEELEKQIENLKKELNEEKASKEYWMNMHNYSSEMSYQYGQKQDREIEKLRKENEDLKNRLKTINFAKTLDDVMTDKYSLEIEDIFGK